jgi:hypothetical protein
MFNKLSSILARLNARLGIFARSVDLDVDVQWGGNGGAGGEDFRAAFV